MREKLDEGKDFKLNGMMVMQMVGFYEGTRMCSFEL